MKKSLTYLGIALMAAAAATASAAPRVLSETSSTFTAEQRSQLAEKVALIDRTLKAFGADRQSAGVSADRQRWMLESLSRMSVAELRALPQGGSIDRLASALTSFNGQSAKPALQKFGQVNTELVYYPITPCRFIDTRVTGTPIVGLPTGSRTYDLDLTGAAYGGSASCNPSATVGGNSNAIAAISMNIAIVDPAAFPGTFSARPIGSTNITSLVNWYEITPPPVQASNAAIVTTDQTGATDELEFFGTPTHFVVDILGVFAAPTASPLDCVAGTLTTTGAIGASAFNLSAGACPANYRMMSNSCQAFGDTANLVLSQHGVIDATNANCAGRYTGAGSVTVTNTPWCCRIPGR
ncbi:MAG TPA: hypothetical protein VNG69_12870 [Casimicrobiaceae bacterium]|nr:hypothetical protein [Casimicrobiaceae bacterium]